MTNEIFDNHTSAQGGFTLVELLVTVAVLGVLAALAAPSFVNLISANRITTQTTEFIAGLNLARAEAVRRVQPVTVRAKAGELDFAPGWEVFPDENADGLAASPATASDGLIIRDGTVTRANIELRRVTQEGASPLFTYVDATTSLADRMRVTFNGRGAVANGGAPLFFRICDSSNQSVPGRVLKVDLVGRVSVLNARWPCTS